MKRNMVQGFRRMPGLWASGLPGLRTVLALFFMLAALVADANSEQPYEQNRTAAFPRQRHVLLLYSSSYLPAYQHLTSAFITELESFGLASTQIHFETMEASIGDSEDKNKRFHEWLREKYAGINMDVVVTVGEQSRSFILDKAVELFPGSAIICTMSRDYSRQTIPGHKLVEVMYRYDFASTIKLAQHLFPKTKLCYVVIGSGNIDQLKTPEITSALEGFSEQISVKFSSGQTLDEILDVVSSLPLDSIVLYITVYNDASGYPSTPLSVARHVVKASASPVFGLYDTLVGSGMIGGSMVSPAQAGKNAARYVYEMICQEPSLPQLTIIPPAYQTVLNWKELERWGIDQGKLPPGVIIFNQPVTIWSQYRSMVVAGLSVIAVLSAMVLALILLNRSRRRAERDARQQKILITGLLDAIQESALLLDTNNVILYANKTASSRFKSAIADLSGHSMDDLAPEELRDTYKTSMVMAIGTGVRQHFVGVYHGRNIDNIVYPISVDGQVCQLAVLALDVTEHVRTRERLHQSLDSLQAQKNDLQKALAWKTVIIENPALLLLVNDRARIVTEVSPGFCSAMASRAEELVGCDSELLFAECEGASQAYAMMDAGSTVQLERKMRRRNGKTSWVLAVGSKMSFPEGPGEYIWVFVDITDRKSAEERETQMLQADKMISMGVMASGIAHEINNPNNSICINAPLLHSVWAGVVNVLDAHAASNPDFHVGLLPYARVREHVPKLIQGIIDGSSRIKNIVHDMKDFVSQKPGDFRDDLDVNAIVASSLNLLSKKLTQYTSNLNIKLGENLPRIRGNAQHLEQVVINLLINAAESLPDVSHTVEVETSHDARRGLILLVVRDNGKGITPEDMPHIFDPFFTTKRESGGTGLGLAISRNIVTAHNGDLVFHSHPGAGTTATVELRISGHAFAQEQA